MTSLCIKELRAYLRQNLNTDSSLLLRCLWSHNLLQGPAKLLNLSQMLLWLLPFPQNSTLPLTFLECYQWKARGGTCLRPMIGQFFICIWPSFFEMSMHWFTVSYCIINWSTLWILTIVSVGPLKQDQQLRKRYPVFQRLTTDQKTSEIKDLFKDMPTVTSVPERPHKDVKDDIIGLSEQVIHFFRKIM